VVLDAEDAGAHCTLGRAYYMRRAHDAAFRELKTALELNPSLALAHYGLGATLVFAGRAEESIPHLKPRYDSVRMIQTWDHFWCDSLMPRIF